MSTATAKYQLLPPLDDGAFQELKADIARRGVLVPIERDEHGEILDGHHRVRACDELAAEGTLVEMPVLLRLDLSEPEKRAHVRALNMLRRHLSASQRRAVVEDQLRDTPERSDRSIAKAWSMSPSTVAMVRRRLGEKDPTVQTGQSKRIGLDGRQRGAPKARSVFASSASHATRALVSLQVLPLGLLPERMLTADETTVASRLVRQEAAREVQHARMKDPGRLGGSTERRYAVLYVDPPWRYEGASDPARKAERHYSTMSHEELRALPMAEIAADNAVLYMWVSPPKVAEAIALLSAWQFEFKTCACWDKGGPNGTRIGLGSFYRQQHELLFVAVRGSIAPPAPANRPPSIIRAERTAHSAKPAQARTQIEAMYGAVPRIELFARGPVPGWDVWGLEAQHDNSPA